ncbi:hypothetical protein T4B_11490, partial [Trichinella pseudospiralis]
MKVVIHHQTNFQFQEKELHQDKVLPPMTQHQDWPFQNKTEANIFHPMHCPYPLARKMDQAIHPLHIQAYLDYQSKKV